MTRILFLCSRNRLRSPTAERVFESFPGLDVASTGRGHDADTPCTPERVNLLQRRVPRYLR